MTMLNPIAIKLPTIDDVWADAPESKLQALDAAILFLRRIDAAMAPLSTDIEHVLLDRDPLLCLALDASELAGNLEALRKELTGAKKEGRA